MIFTSPQVELARWLVSHPRGVASRKERTVSERGAGAKLVVRCIWGLQKRGVIRLSGKRTISLGSLGGKGIVAGHRLLTHLPSTLAIG